MGNKAIAMLVGRMSEETVRAMLAELLNGDSELTNIAASVVERPKPQPWGKAGGKANVEPKPVDGRSGPRVAYVLTRKNVKIDFGGFRTAEKTFKAIQKGAASGSTKPQIMARSGLGKKTVESCIHHLIHVGAIKSVAVA